MAHACMTQVVITDEEIERDILEVYRPLSSPDGVENWTILGKYSVVFRRRLGQREVWVETPVLHFSVTANAMKVDKGKKDQSYYYGDLGGLRWWFKGRSSTAKIRFGNTTKARRRDWCPEARLLCLICMCRGYVVRCRKQTT